MSPLAPLLASVLAVAAPNSAAHEVPLVEHSRFSIEVPSNVLTGVPVRKIVIRAFDANGKPDASYNDQPLITGIRLAVPQTDDAKLGPFHDGVLELSTDLHAGRKVYISDPQIVVDAGDRRSARLDVTRTFRWLALAPAVVAFLLCLWPRNFVLAMFVAVLCGTAILDHGNLFHAFVQTIDSFVLVDASATAGASTFHITTLTVMLFFGSLFSVLTASGGLAGLTDRLGRRAKTREGGQLLALLFGFGAFFDDYAHALIVGKTLRPLSDRLKISREKFAFLVDTTCAPVTALAIVSTWLAAERGTIRETFASLGSGGGATATLLASLPYCFYPILMLIFAALAIFLGHDFGPMFRAEWRAATQHQLSRPDVFDPQVLPAADNESHEGRKLARNAWIPISLFIGLVAVGVWWTGTEELASLASNAAPTAAAQPAESSSWLDVLEHAKAQRVLLFSVFIASAAAVALGVWSRTLTLQQGLSAWVSGLQRMVPAALILLLSWSFQRICDADHLNTAGFLTEIGQPRVTVEWVPLVAFLAVGLTSFIVGSSWAALPLALPLFISVTHALLVDLNEASATHPLLLATIGAVISGTVFGHHCSPISETTVLSSASTSCSHLDHVFTQLPYAITVASVVALFGYLPVAYGHSPVVLLPVATIVLLLILQFGGRPAVQASEGAAETEPTSKPADANAAAHPSKGGTPPAPSEARKPVAAAAAKAASGRPS
ncbi:MAG TPA: Na+/H+ antiporter NhaC family protein [Planctomycetaceae bacterium]|jgi:Na+/H+ antiporter NhaC|nr:Na+/H+ antiporter NhaC family protein [Planctomycetaceae bacterium]